MGFLTFLARNVILTPKNVFMLYIVAPEVFTCIYCILHKVKSHLSWIFPTLLGINFSRHFTRIHSLKRSRIVYENWKNWNGIYFSLYHFIRNFLSNFSNNIFIGVVIVYYNLNSLCGIQRGKSDMFLSNINKVKVEMRNLNLYEITNLYRKWGSCSELCARTTCIFSIYRFDETA